MRSGYLVESIMHSGRKGTRYALYTDSKYEGLEKYIVVFDPDTIQQGKPLHMTVVDSPKYEWWDTTMVVATIQTDDEQVLYLETVNTIYKLRKADDQEQYIDIYDNKPYRRMT